MSTDQRLLLVDAANSHVNPEAIRPDDLVSDYRGALFFVNSVNEEKGYLSIKPTLQTAKRFYDGYPDNWQTEVPIRMMKLLMRKHETNEVHLEEGIHDRRAFEERLTDYDRKAATGQLKIKRYMSSKEIKQTVKKMTVEQRESFLKEIQKEQDDE